MVKFTLAELNSELTKNAEAIDRINGHFDEAKRYGFRPHTGLTQDSHSLACKLLASAWERYRASMPNAIDHNEGWRL